MKCKICGHEILDTDTICSGCDTDVEELKKNDNIIYGTKPVEIPESEVPDVEKKEETVENNVEETVDMNSVVVDDNKESTNNIEVPIETPIVGNLSSEIAIESNAPVVEETVENNVGEAIDMNSIVPEDNKESTLNVEVPIETPTVEENTSDNVENKEVANEDAIDVVITNELDNKDLDTVTEDPKIASKETKKKGSIGKILLIILLLLVVVVGGVGGYYLMIYTKPSTIMSKMFESTNNIFDGVLSEKYMKLKVNFKSDMDIDFEANMDSTNLTGVADITLRKDGESRNINVINNSEYSYIRLDDLYTDSFKIPNEILVSKLNYEGYAKLFMNRSEAIDILNTLNKKIPSMINENNLSKEFTSINYDQKNMGVIKYQYKVDGKDSSALVNNIINELKNNSDITNDLIKITSLNKDEINNNIDEYVKNINISNIEFNLYTDYLAKTYYSSELIINNNNDKYQININYDNNKVNDIKVVTTKLDLNLSDNMKNIDILTKENNKKYVITYNYSKINSISSDAPEEYTEYDDEVFENIKSSMNEDSILKTVYEVLIKEEINEEEDVTETEDSQETESIDNNQETSGIE